MNGKGLVAAIAFSVSLGSLPADVIVDVDKFGALLGGWDTKGKKAADYDVGATEFRTYKPTISPTPDGGKFISLRVDNVRGFFATNDFASLSMTVGKDGELEAAQSSVHFQGHKVTSDIIKSSAEVAGGTAMDQAVRIGARLMSSLSEKISRENRVEAGRVNFPNAIQHNLNHLFASISVKKEVVAVIVPEEIVEPVFEEPTQNEPVEEAPAGEEVPSTE